METFTAFPGDSINFTHFPFYGCKAMNDVQRGNHSGAFCFEIGRLLGVPMDKPDPYQFPPASDRHSYLPRLRSLLHQSARVRDHRKEDMQESPPHHVLLKIPGPGYLPT